MINTRQLRLANAVDKLKEWQPGAIDVRLKETACPECHGNRWLTYVLFVSLNNPPTDTTLENCGYYCPDCGLGNRGARKR